MPGDSLKQEMVADIAAVDALWPLLPTETEIYLLPDGRVVIADMPVELAELVAQLGIIVQASTVAPMPSKTDESA